jgi:hypothetical protein
MFKIEISTDGAVFKEPYEGTDDRFQEGLEIKRILEDVAGQIEAGMTSGPCMDINGNKVGSWSR